jgi:hypothetical protein
MTERPDRLSIRPSRDGEPRRDTHLVSSMLPKQLPGIRYRKSFAR